MLDIVLKSQLNLSKQQTKYTSQCFRPSDNTTVFDSTCGHTLYCSAVKKIISLRPLFKPGLVPSIVLNEVFTTAIVFRVCQKLLFKT